MKAMQLAAPGGLDNLKLVELPAAAAPGAGQIQVRIHASSLNYHDLGVVSRPGAAADGRIPMADGAGVVTAVGAGVTEFAVGDAVVSTFFPQWLAGRNVPTDFQLVPGDGVDGFARESITLPATSFTHAPKGWSHAEASTLTTAGLTAWRALVVDGGIQAGDTVLVLGTGGVSIFALQMAKSMGAKVIATTSSAAKAERLQALGADVVINYKDTPEWGDAVLAATGGRGADIVVEVGGGYLAPVHPRLRARRPYRADRRAHRHCGRRAHAGADAQAANPQRPDRRQPRTAAGHGARSGPVWLEARDRQPLPAGAHGRCLSASALGPAFRQDLPGILIADGAFCALI